MASMMAKMLKDPEMRKAMAQQQKMGLNMVYGSLFKHLQLTPEQEDKFKEILLDQHLSNMSQAGGLMEGGERRAEVMQQMAADQKEREQQMKDLLGEEKFAQYQNYNQTIGERMAIEQLGKEVEITPEQSEFLMAIIGEEKKNAQINMGVDLSNSGQNMQAVLGSPEITERFLQQQEQVTARVLERASQVLTPDQVRKLAPVLESQLEMQRAGVKMARQMFNTGETPPPAE
jgi:hypothetical protein